MLPRDILGEQGALAERIADFAPRPQQLAMADAIAAAIAADQSFICEAGTGKTFAYLARRSWPGKRPSP